MLAERHDEWTEGRRYLRLEVLKRARLTAVDETTAAATNTEEENTTSAIPDSAPDRAGRSRVKHHVRGLDLQRRRADAAVVAYLARHSRHLKLQVSFWPGVSGWSGFRGREPTHYGQQHTLRAQ